MTDTARSAAAVSPASVCTATLVDELMICDRCGLSWPQGEPAMACDPMTFNRMRERLLTQIQRAEISLMTVSNIAAGGKLPADPADARRELAECHALLRLFERVTCDQVIKDRLNGKTK